jgi:hypothetical protein
MEGHPLGIHVTSKEEALSFSQMPPLDYLDRAIPWLISK